MSALLLLMGSPRAVAAGGATWSLVDTIQSTTAGSDATPTVLNKPTGLISGDILISHQRPGDVTMLPAGFATLAASSADGDGYVFFLAWKQAGGSEPSTYTFNDGSILSTNHCSLFAVRSSTGPHASVIDAYTQQNYSNTTSPTAPSVTATADNSYWIVFFRASDVASETITTPPAGFTLLGSVTSSAASASLLTVFYGKPVNAGATGTAAIVFGHTEWGASASLILRPA